VALIRVPFSIKSWIQRIPIDCLNQQAHVSRVKSAGCTAVLRTECTASVICECALLRRLRTLQHKNVRIRIRLSQRSRCASENVSRFHLDSASETWSLIPIYDFRVQTEANENLRKRKFSLCRLETVESVLVSNENRKIS
jgi:hypothetical protein